MQVSGLLERRITEVLKEFKAEEIVRAFAAQAEGRQPSLVVKGVGARREFNRAQALDTLARIRGLYRDKVGVDEGLGSMLEQALERLARRKN